jgi:spermidine/putrescine transport system permease protein
MLLSFVVPELVLGVALLFLVANLFRLVHLGAAAQLLGLVTFQLSYPAVIVRERLLSIGPEYEEAAMTSAPPPHGRPGGYCCRCCGRRSSPARCWSSPT